MSTKRELREQLIALNTDIATQNFQIGEVATGLGHVCIDLGERRVPDISRVLQITERLENYMKVAEVLKNRIDILSTSVEELKD